MSADLIANFVKISAVECVGLDATVQFLEFEHRSERR